MRKCLAVFALLVLLVAPPAFAYDEGSLFVNLTTDEPHRASMALRFSEAMMERGHPLAIWLNDKGVLLAAKDQADKLGEQQKALATMIEKGATVLVCPYCMKHYGVAEADLIDGAKLGNPDLTGGLLFKDDTRTLSW